MTPDQELEHLIAERAHWGQLFDWHHARDGRDGRDEFDNAEHCLVNIRHYSKMIAEHVARRVSERIS